MIPTIIKFMAARKKTANTITNILPRIPKMIFVVLLRSIRATIHPTKQDKASAIIEITNVIRTPQISAATENFVVKYIKTAGNQNKVENMTQLKNRTAMRENRIIRGGIGIERSRVLSFALKIMLYETNALNAMQAISAINPNKKKYIQSKPALTKPSTIAHAQRQMPKNKTMNKIPISVAFRTKLLLSLDFFFFFFDAGLPAPKKRIAKSSLACFLIRAFSICLSISKFEENFFEALVPFDFFHGSALN